MIKQINGNIFDSKADVICHQVNVYGVMGAGIAAEVKQRYPQVDKEYRYKCSYAKDISDLLGGVQFVETYYGSRQYISNCFSQCEVPDSNGVLTSYSAIAECFVCVKNWLIINKKKTVAIPYKIGCGIAGGDWNKVSEIIENVFGNDDLTCEIWKLK